MPFMRAIGSWSLSQTVLRAVGVFFDGILDRQEGGRPVVLRPIELDAAGDPRPGQPHQGRLDHRLPIDEVVAVGLVLGDVDPAADLRQDHDPQIFIFQPDGLPSPVGLGLGNSIGERQRIDLPAAALIDPLLQEHGVLVRRSGKIGRNDFVGDANGDGFHYGRSARGRVGSSYSATAASRRNRVRSLGVSACVSHLMQLAGIPFHHTKLSGRGVTPVQNIFTIPPLLPDRNRWRVFVVPPLGVILAANQGYMLPGRNYERPRKAYGPPNTQFGGPY